MTYRSMCWGSFLLFCMVIVGDRLSKIWALGSCQYEIVMSQFVSFQCIMNRGVSWGLFHSENNGVFLFVSTCIAGVLSYFLWYMYQLWIQRKSLIAPALVLGGAMSNFVDRCLYGGVIDFIVVHYGAWTWPVFNIADIAICVGIGLMLCKHNTCGG